jgi:hypothetical protein
VVLKSAKYPNKEPVAYAMFMSCDSNAQVGGVALGKQFWKVRVTHPMEENEELVRPWGSSKGKTVSLPSVLEVYRNTYLLWFRWLVIHHTYIFSKNYYFFAGWKG